MSELANTPRRLRKPSGELMGDPDPEESKRVTDAMLKMQKIIVADLQKAYDANSDNYLLDFLE